MAAYPIPDANVCLATCAKDSIAFSFSNLGSTEVNDFARIICLFAWIAWVKFAVKI